MQRCYVFVNTTSVGLVGIKIFPYLAKFYLIFAWLQNKIMLFLHNKRNWYIIVWKCFSLYDSLHFEHRNSMSPILSKFQSRYTTFQIKLKYPLIMTMFFRKMFFVCCQEYVIFHTTLMNELKSTYGLTLKSHELFQTILCEDKKIW